MTKNSKLLNFTPIFILLFVILTSKSNIIMNTSSSEQMIDISNISREVEVLEQEVIEIQGTEENIYLIFFEKSSEYTHFTARYETELNFNGLLGTTIKATPTELATIVEDNVNLAYQNIYPITTGNKGKFIPNSQHDENNFVKPSVQSLVSAQVTGVDKLWELGYRGQGTTIAIIDEGINASHPDFSFANGTSRIKAAEGFVNTTYGNEEDLENIAGSHGTWVAGIAAGGGIQSAANQGIANESWILDADVDEGPENYLDMTLFGEIAAINWAIENGVDVINRSYGEPDGEEAYWDMMLYPGYQLRLATIRQAIKQGVIFVHSAGNEGGSMYAISPDNFVDEISVGATDAGMQAMAPYSSRGPIWGTNAVSPDVIAPGTAVPTPAVQGGYGTPQGTSFSAPHVAGVSAILLGAMKEQNLDVNPGTIKAALMATATDIGVELNAQGAGQINASAAYEYLLAAPRVGNHIIAGAVNPKNLIFTNFPKVLQGSSFKKPFTFVSTETANVSVQLEGNLSSFLTITEQQWLNSSDLLSLSESNLVDGALSDYYSHTLALQIIIPDDAPLGYYSGNIIFKVNSTEIYSTPFQFDIESANRKVLFFTGNRADFSYNSLGRFSDFQNGLSEQGIVLNENNSEITAEVLSGYDTLWIAADNRTYQKYVFLLEQDAVMGSPENRLVSTQVQNTIMTFVSNGGSVILTPFSTPLGLESLLNAWGISTLEISPSFGIKPAQLTHSNTIGLSTDYFDASGSYFDVETPAVPLAYINERKNVVMASYDDPYGGRVVVVSGSTFIGTRGYNNDINDGTSYNPLFNDRLVTDVLSWGTRSRQLFGTYIRHDNEISVSLRATDNFVANNTAFISGKTTDVILDVESDISSEIPQNGTNGWYNFTLSLSEGVHAFNFTWGLEFVSFELITDETRPKIRIFGMENNSYLTEDTEVTFWFFDDESGINKHQVEMTVDGLRVGFNGPKTNYTGKGFYIEKDLRLTDFKGGKHEIVLSVSDIAGNSASVKFIFTRGSPPGSETTDGSKASGFLFESLFSLVIFIFAVSKGERRKGRNSL